MSRHVLLNEDYQFAYGYDHIFGWFVQVFRRSGAFDDDEGLIRDEDGLTPETICTIAEQYGFQIEPPERTIL